MRAKEDPKKENPKHGLSFLPSFLFFSISLFIMEGFTPSSSVRTYLLIFLPVIVLPLVVLTVRAVRWVWNYFQPRNEYGEKDISDFHKKWRSGFSRFRTFMETSEFGKLWVCGPPSEP